MRSMWMLLLALGVGVPLAGCDQLTGDKKKTEKKDDEDSGKKKKKKTDETDSDEDDEEASAKPKASEAAPTATATATETAAPTATATATATDAAPTSTGTTPPPPQQPTLPGRSATPTVDEWNAAPEISVTGSSKLGCETKGVREWVRVSCRGNDASRGEPTGATISRGGGKGDTFVLNATGVASIVYPFYEGQELVAKFSWERHSSDFTAGWPQGAPKPSVYGVFANTNVKPATTTTATATATVTPTATATATATTTSTTKPSCNSDADCPRGLKCKAGTSGARVCVREGLKLPGK